MTRQEVEALEARLAARYGEVVTIPAGDVMALIRDYRLAQGVIEALIWSRFSFTENRKVAKAMKAYQARNKTPAS